MMLALAMTFTLLFTLSLSLFVLGLIKPEFVLRKGEKSRRMVTLIYGCIALAMSVFMITATRAAVLKTNEPSLAPSINHQQNYTDGQKTADESTSESEAKQKVPEKEKKPEDLLPKNVEGFTFYSKEATPRKIAFPTIGEKEVQEARLLFVPVQGKYHYVKALLIRITEIPHQEEKTVPHQEEKTVPLEFGFSSEQIEDKIKERLTKEIKERLIEYYKPLNNDTCNYFHADAWITVWGIPLTNTSGSTVHEYDKGTTFYTASFQFFYQEVVAFYTGYPNAEAKNEARKLADKVWDDTVQKP